MLFGYKCEQKDVIIVPQKMVHIVIGLTISLI